MTPKEFNEKMGEIGFCLDGYYCGGDNGIEKVCEELKRAYAQLYKKASGKHDTKSEKVTRLARERLS